MKKPEFNDSISSDGLVLKCPQCGCDYLHQDCIRAGSDFLEVVFWCEGCHEQHTILANQYKGQTQFSWLK